MNGSVGAPLLMLVLPLFLIGGLAAVAAWRESPALPDDDAAHYCRICESHTMCRFPYDDPGPNCEDVENGDLDVKEIEWILHEHNLFRNSIARAVKSYVPWLPERDMMQVFWDEELANIARRWVLQCNLFDKDDCRDTEQFSVMQNVNALDLQDVGNSTSLERLIFHMKTWHDKLDLPNVGSGIWEDVGWASPAVTNIGCARATYNVDVRDWQTEMDGHRFYPEPQLNRFETLVCNYGPNEYEGREQGISIECKLPSQQYSMLCSEIFATRRHGIGDAERGPSSGEDAGESKRNLTGGKGKGATVASAAATPTTASPGATLLTPLTLLIILLLLRLWLSRLVLAR